MSLLKLITEDKKVEVKKLFKESMREKVKAAIKLYEAEFASTLLKNPEDEENDVEIVVDGQELDPETSEPIEDVDMKDDLLGSVNETSDDNEDYIKSMVDDIDKDEAFKYLQHAFGQKNVISTLPNRIILNLNGKKVVLIYKDNVHLTTVISEEENPWKVINKETKKTVKSFKSAGEAEKFISNTKDGNKKYYKDYKKPNGKMIGEAKKAK